MAIDWIGLPGEEEVEKAEIEEGIPEGLESIGRVTLSQGKLIRTSNDWQIRERGRGLKGKVCQHYLSH